MTPSSLLSSMRTHPRLKGLMIIMSLGFVMAPSLSHAQGSNQAAPPAPQVQNASQNLAPSWREPTPSEREAALRSDPLIRATFFTRLFEHNPQDVRSGMILAEALRALGRNGESADVAHRILIFQPDNIEALQSAAKAHIADNNGFYAIDLLKHNIDLEPKSWQAYSLLGVAYDQVKRPTEAQAAWATALQLSPNNPVVLTNKAMSLAANGHFPEAETLLRQAVAQPKATAQMRQNLALILGLEGQWAQSEALMRQDLPPEQVEQNLAWLRSKTNQATGSQGATGSKASSGPQDSPHSWSDLKPQGQ